MPDQGEEELFPEIAKQDLEEKINEVLLKVQPGFKLLPEDEKHKATHTLSVSLQRTIRHSYRGPLPRPEDLEKYSKVIPNGADRIMIMAEKQQDHRMALESKVIGEQQFQSKLGQWFGFIIGLVVVIGGVGCVVSGHEIAGLIFSGTGLTGLVSVFVIGKKSQVKTPKEKN